MIISGKMKVAQDYGEDVKKKGTWKETWIEIFKHEKIRIDYNYTIDAQGGSLSDITDEETEYIYIYIS